MFKICILFICSYYLFVISNKWRLGMGLCLFSLPSVYIGLDIGTVYVMVNCQVNCLHTCRKFDFRFYLFKGRSETQPSQ